MIVLIDDERDFIDTPDNAVIFRNSDTALQWLNSLDGTETIDQIWFEEKCFFGDAPEIGQIIVHTSNNVGGKEIFESMNRYYKTVRVFAGDYLIVH